MTKGAASEPELPDLNPSPTTNKLCDLGLITYNVSVLLIPVCEAGTAVHPPHGLVVG